ARPPVPGPGQRARRPGGRHVAPGLRRLVPRGRRTAAVRRRGRRVPQPRRPGAALAADHPRGRGREGADGAGHRAGHPCPQPPAAVPAHRPEGVLGPDRRVRRRGRRLGPRYRAARRAVHPDDPRHHDLLRRALVSSELRAGTLAGVAAYALWGSFPLYFRALEPTGALEVLAHRILWSLVVVGLVLLVRRRHRWLAPLRRDRAVLAQLALAAVLIALNWLVYVWAVAADRVVDAALGYFVNPPVTVALGVVVLGERLRRMPWVAVALGAAAVLVITVGYGRVPWVSFVLAGSFAGYGFLKRRNPLRALASLAAATALLAPVAAVLLVLVARRPDGPAELFGGGIRFDNDGW